MQVRCSKCRFKYDVAIPDDGSIINAICPRCGNHQQVQGEVKPIEVEQTAPVISVQQPVQQPVQQQPVQQQPVQQQPVQQPIPQPQQPTIIYQQKQSNTLPIVLAVAIVATLAVLGFVWMNNRSTNNELTSQVSETVDQASTEMTDIDAAKKEVAEVADAVKAAVEETSNEFSPEYTPSGYENFAQLPFDIQQQLQNISHNISSFADVKRDGKCRGNQITYENYDGVRYQIFFDENVSSSSALVTGIAISRQTNDPSGDCWYMDNVLENAGYSDLGNIYYNSSTNMYFSPGYKGNRVYCYIYTSRAPDKGTAPRG